MGSVLRSIFAVIGGVVISTFLILAIEAVGMMIFPPPPGTDMSNPEAVKAVMANAPAGVLLFVLLGWLVGTLAGSWAAARIARRGADRPWDDRRGPGAGRGRREHAPDSAPCLVLGARRGGVPPGRLARRADRRGRGTALRKSPAGPLDRC